ncbi:MAG: glutathione ABC transporter permease GsiC, partial [Candidatus Sumerlaeota bacterium]|nr:glutathione ABC transporter permease GsiC [Candidatus Sumerlaeota bacterium]
MISAIAYRLLQAVPTLLGVSVLVFFLLTLTGDPVRQMLGPEASAEAIRQLRHELRLDQPAAWRYFSW